MVRFFRSEKSVHAEEAEASEACMYRAQAPRDTVAQAAEASAADQTTAEKSSSTPPKHTLLAALGAVILAAGCAAGVGNPTTDQTSGTTQISTEAERAAAGVYEGVIPAADGPGIHVALYVRAVGTYTRIDTYLERNLTTVEDGRWSVKGNRIQMTPLDPKKPIRWAERHGNELHLMDMNGNPITGALAENYVLRKN